MRDSGCAAVIAAILLAGQLALPARGEGIEDLTVLCLDCHGEASRAADPTIPAIGGQPELFVMYQLHFFRSGQRENEDMNEIMADISDDQLRALAQHVSALPPPAPPAGDADLDRYRRGAALAARHICHACHDADYGGRDQMPRLAGQQEAYLVKVYDDYRSGARIGTQAAMAEIVRAVSAEEWADLAHFLAHYRVKQ